MTTGTIIAIIGAAVAAASCGIASSIGVMWGGKASAGVLAEKPELFGRMLLLQALPGTQGIYGFLAAVLLMVRIGILGGGAEALTVSQGWAYFGTMMPITILGTISALLQARLGVSCIHMTAANPDVGGRGVIMAALVETYAILGLLVSILLVFGV